MANEMNKICSLFNALDPDEDLTKDWFKRILKLLQDDASQDARGKQLEDDMANTQVYDTMKIFIEKLLDQNSELTGEVADKLVESLRNSRVLTPRRRLLSRLRRYSPSRPSYRRKLLSFCR